jgi:hypothetical protein
MPLFDQAGTFTGIVSVISNADDAHYTCLG